MVQYLPVEKTYRIRVSGLSHHVPHELFPVCPPPNLGNPTVRAKNDLNNALIFGTISNKTGKGTMRSTSNAQRQKRPDGF